MSNYTRNQNVIYDVSCGTSKREHFKSINAAKRRSRELQRKGHTVKVIPHVTTPQKMHAVARKVR